MDVDPGYNFAHLAGASTPHDFDLASPSPWRDMYMRAAPDMTPAWSISTLLANLDRHRVPYVEALFEALFGYEGVDHSVVTEGAPTFRGTVYRAVSAMQRGSSSVTGHLNALRAFAYAEHRKNNVSGV